MDVLTDVLDTLRFRSTLYCRVELGAPWSLHFAPTPVASFHVIERGAGWLKVDGDEPPIPVCGGDLLVLTTGAGHLLSDEPDRPPVVTIELGRDAPDSPELRCYDGTGGTTVLLCGLFDLEQRRGHPLLSVLPPLVHIKGNGGQAAPWLDTTLRFLASEVGAARLGRDTLVRRLTDLLFIQVVRAWAESEAAQTRGWLAFGRAQLAQETTGGFGEHFAIDGGSEAAALFTIAHSALTFLSTGDLIRLHRCDNPRCTLYFVDTTKSATRRWCSNGCMNRARSAQRYAALRANESNS